MPRMVFNWVLWRYTILYINERSWESGGVVRLAQCVKCEVHVSFQHLSACLLTCFELRLRCLVNFVVWQPGPLFYSAHYAWFVACGDRSGATPARP